MANELTIFRPATVEEKKDFVELSRTNISNPDMFLAALAKKTLDYQKKFVPYDAYGARMDFEEEIQKHITQQAMAVNEKNVDPLSSVDLNKYADPKRFNFVQKEDVMDDKLLDGIRTTVRIGYYYYFIAKRRGNGISLFIPFSKDESMNKVPHMEKWLEDNGFTDKPEAEAEIKVEEGTI